MKSHIRPKVSNKQRAYVKEIVSEEIVRQRNDTTRRLLKLFCTSLHRRFGWGTTRLARLVDDLNDLLSEEGRESEFWYRVDKLMESLGMDFEKED